MCIERIISAVALDGWDRSVSLTDSFTPRNQLNIRLGWLQSQNERVGDEKISFT
jgi:hypothetical protein